MLWVFKITLQFARGSDPKDPQLQAVSKESSIPKLGLGGEGSLCADGSITFQVHKASDDALIRAPGLSASRLRRRRTAGRRTAASRSRLCCCRCHSSPAKQHAALCIHKEDNIRRYQHHNKTDTCSSRQRAMPKSRSHNHRCTPHSERVRRHRNRISMQCLRLQFRLLLSKNSRRGKLGALKRVLGSRSGT